MPSSATSSKPSSCAKCSGTDLERRVMTYPVRLIDPPAAAGKQVEVGRVALYMCQSCGHLMPTAAGQAKIERIVGQLRRVLFG